MERACRSRARPRTRSYARTASRRRSRAIDDASAIGTITRSSLKRIPSNASSVSAAAARGVSATGAVPACIPATGRPATPGPEDHATIVGGLFMDAVEQPSVSSCRPGSRREDARRDGGHRISHPLSVNPNGRRAVQRSSHPAAAPQEAVHADRRIDDAKSEQHPPGNTLQAAPRAMDELNVGAMPGRKNGRLVGVLTDRDIVVRSGRTRAPRSSRRR